MVLVENAFLYSGAGDGFYYRVNTKKVGVTHFMRDNGAAWRASVEGKKMPIAQLEPVGNLA